MGDENRIDGLMKRIQYLSLQIKRDSAPGVSFFLSHLFGVKSDATLNNVPIRIFPKREKHADARKERSGVTPLNTASPTQPISLHPPMPLLPFGPSLPTDVVYASGIVTLVNALPVSLHSSLNPPRKQFLQKIPEDLPNAVPNAVMMSPRSSLPP